MVPARRLVLPLLISLFLISSLFLVKQAFAVWVFDFDPPTLELKNPSGQVIPNAGSEIFYQSQVTVTLTCQDGANDWNSKCQSISYALRSADPANFVITNNPDKLEPFTVPVTITPNPGESFVQIFYKAQDYAGNTTPAQGATYWGKLSFYPYKISGFIWIDDNGNGTQQPGENTCYTGSATIVLTGVSPGSLSDTKTFNFTRATQPCDTYTFPVPAGTYTVDLSLTGWTVTASPPAITTPPDKTDANFGVTVKTWWQTKLGDVRAATGKLDDVIPSFCTPPQCKPYVSLTGNNSPGIVLAATNFSLDAGRTNEFNWKVLDSLSNPTVYSYEYIKARVTPTGTFDGSKPSSSGVYTTAGPITLDGPSWNNPVPQDTKITILVEGNLTINRNVQVANGGFLAFYVKDDILVDPSIGTNFNNPTSFNLQGIYIADGSFDTGVLQSCSVGNNRLNVAGTIVIDANADGTGNLIQKRCLTAQQSQTYPAFYIEYRPDFLLSAPPVIQSSSFVWQEIAP